MNSLARFFTFLFFEKKNQEERTRNTHLVKAAPASADMCNVAYN